MLAVRLQNKSIKVICSGNQIIDTSKLKNLYRTSLKFLNQNNKLPVIIEIEKNVKISDRVQELFNKIETKCSDRTLIIIAGQL